MMDDDVYVNKIDERSAAEVHEKKFVRRKLFDPQTPEEPQLLFLRVLLYITTVKRTTIKYSFICSVPRNEKSKGGTFLRR